MYNEVAPEIIGEDGGPITAERLREETSIGGWLVLFLFAMMAGSIVSMFIMLSDFNRAEVGGNWFLALADPLLSFTLFLLACFTLYSFIRRRPGAVFLAKTYVVTVFMSGLLLLVINSVNGGGINTGEIMRPLIWGAVWFAFLCVSTRVEQVIPSEYRRIEKADWWAVGVLIGVPVLCLITGLVQLNHNGSMHEKQEAEFLQNVVLADGEYTDGRIVFACPAGFKCEEEHIDGDTFYYMETETQSITVGSEYNSDESNRCANTYWKESEGSELSTYYYIPSRDRMETINGNKAYVKIGKYESRGTGLYTNYIYRRFALIFDSGSDKMCLVSCFDQGDGSYFEPFLKTIRFE